MPAPSPCPDPVRWVALLDSRLPEPVARSLSSHLEVCPGCQTTLDHLTAADETWIEAGRQVGQRPRPELRRAMDHLKTEGEAGRDTVVDPTLPFLRPPAKPEHLGRLGPYEVLSVIGRGGMGVVLKAFDPALRRLTAIKVVAPQWATHDQARQRFEREARAAALVRHETVVAIHAVEEADGVPYLVMEYVPGESLQQRLDRTGPLPLEEILYVGSRAAAGLAAAHARDLVHRDVKPANILLDEAGRVRLTDFGLARAVDDTSLTQTGVIAGTPQYMSPEQARGEKVDHRADLFSLGSVLYAMCTGRPPFRAPTTVAVLKQVCDEMPADVRDRNPDVPAWLAQIIVKLHAKRPRDRFQTADEVARLLTRHLRHFRSPDKFEKPDPVAGVRRPALPPWWPAVLVVPGTLVLALLIWGVIHVLTPKRNGDSQPQTRGPEARVPQIPEPRPPEPRPPEPQRPEPQRPDPPRPEPKGPLPRADGDVLFQQTLADLDSRDHFTRKGAIERLAGMKPNDRRAEVAEKLVALSTHESPFYRRPAVRALGSWGSKNELPALIRATVHPDTFTRSEALKVIGRFREARVVEAVMVCFRENSTRRDASDALRDLGPMAEPDVLAVVTDRDDNIFLKRDAILVLVDIGTAKCVPALRQVLASQNVHYGHLREPAQQALAAVDRRKK